jgi:glutamate synthase domain-containing protein 2
MKLASEGRRMECRLKTAGGSGTGLDTTALLGGKEAPAAARFIMDIGCRLCCAALERKEAVGLGTIQHDSFTVLLLVVFAAQ